MPEWAVVEFDAEQAPVWTAGPYDEADARARFVYVTRQRSQRADVVQRSRSAALLCRNQVVEACSIRHSKRAPLLGNKRLHHVDVDSREAIIGLELLGHDLARAATRHDGQPRVGPGWVAARAVACAIWDLVRGVEADRVSGPAKGGDAWWMVEWTCGCCQVERTEAGLWLGCPYHDAPRRRAPLAFEPGW